uniref:Band 7 domain containing protein n=1 Tax=Haemonchus contortus TaxID=6289 RepID=A0A7I4YDJ9_HAECO
MSSRGQDLDFKSIDFLRTRLMYNGAVVQHRYRRPDDTHTATRLVSTGFPSCRYIIASSRTITGSIPAALSGQGYVISVGNAVGARPESSRKDAAANLVLLAREAKESSQVLEQAADAALIDANARSLVSSRVAEEMKEVHAVTADTQQKVAEIVAEAGRLQRESYPPTSEDVRESVSMNPPLKKMRSELNQILPDKAGSDTNTSASNFR